MFVVPWMAVKRGAWLRALSIPDQSAREKSLESISIAIAGEKKVLGCHKFCLSIASIG